MESWRWIRRGTGGLVESPHDGLVAAHPCLRPRGGHPRSVGAARSTSHFRKPGAEQRHGAGDVRAEHAADIATLTALAQAQLRITTDRAEYAYLLEAVLAFEGVAGWSENLAWGLTNEEYEVACPQCTSDLFIVLGERGFFSCGADHALSQGDADMESKPLRPANPADLKGIARRLHDTALADDQQEVARALLHLFGDATCPDCGTGFPVAAQVNAGVRGTAPS